MKKCNKEDNVQIRATLVIICIKVWKPNIMMEYKSCIIFISNGRTKVKASITLFYQKSIASTISEQRFERKLASMARSSRSPEVLLFILPNSEFSVQAWNGVIVNLSQYMIFVAKKTLVLPNFSTTFDTSILLDMNSTQIFGITFSFYEDHF